jgi:excinuclease UvrABC nuclease subunit
MQTIWRPNLAELPEGPGVYLFRNGRGAILYVGKALNLRRRIASYYHQRRRQPAKLRRMIIRARAVTIHATGSELEALLLESRLIKQERPPFNLLSITYSPLPFVKLTLGEAFPRLLLSRQLIPDGSDYLGPFPHFEVAAVILLALQRLFPLRSCDSVVLPGVFPTPCEAFHLRKCAAPCVGWPTALTYPQVVAELRMLLRRGHTGLLQRLREERQRAADAMLFERAGHVHSLLDAVDRATLGRPLSLLPVARRNLVVMLAPRTPFTPEIYCVYHGMFAGRLSLDGQSDVGQTIETFLTRVYTGPDPLQQGGAAVVDELHLVAGWLHRTQARAQWVYPVCQQNLTAVMDTVMRTISWPRPMRQRRG